MRIVTADQVRAHVRIGSTDTQADIYAEAAEQAAQDFLNRQVYPDTNALAAAVLDGTAGDDPIVANPAIVAAVLLITGHLFNHRETVADAAVAELPMGAHALLWPHRVKLGV